MRTRCRVSGVYYLVLLFFVVTEAITSNLMAWAPFESMGPFPLIIFSHTKETYPFNYENFLEEVAFAGYMVAAPVGCNTHDDALEAHGTAFSQLTTIEWMKNSTFSPYYDIIDMSALVILWGHGEVGGEGTYTNAVDGAIVEDYNIGGVYLQSYGTTDPRSIKNVSALFTGGSSDPNYLAVEMGFDNAAGPAVKAIYDDVDETDCIEFLTENNECKILTEAVKYFDCITQGIVAEGDASNGSFVVTVAECNNFVMDEGYEWLSYRHDFT